MSSPEFSQPEVLNEPSQLFHAHLEVMVHLLRDELRWSGEGNGSSTGNGNSNRNGNSSRMVALLHRERRHLLRQQDGNLAREARFRVLGDRLVSRLENEVGIDPKDAAVVVWFYRSEVAVKMAAERARQAEPRMAPEVVGWETGGEERSEVASYGALMHQVGDAHARLLDGSDPFLPLPNRRPSAGFPLAVAVAATRRARQTRQETTWMDVEPLALEILQVVLGRRSDRAAS